MINYRNRPPEPSNGSDQDVRETIKTPSIQPELPPNENWSNNKWLNKSRAANFLGMSRAGFDRARKKKKSGVPGYELFPNDYQPSGNERGHLRYRIEELAVWRDNNKK